MAAFITNDRYTGENLIFYRRIIYGASDRYRLQINLLVCTSHLIGYRSFNVGAFFINSTMSLDCLINHITF